jgi:hypothetical protein
MDWVEVRGQSMAPFLQPGDQVGVEWIEPGYAAALGPGEVVLGRDNRGDWILHRVVDRRHSKGDAAHAWDGFADAQIWARAVALRLAGAGEPIPLSTDWRDRLVARLSRMTMSPRRLPAALARRVLAALARWKRRSLALRSRG